jgi:hypothetical protein
LVLYNLQIFQSLVFQGIGAACPLYIDSANNDLTGREIQNNEVKELIVQLHNEVGKWSSIFRKLLEFSHQFLQACEWEVIR